MIIINTRAHETLKIDFSLIFRFHRTIGEFETFSVFFNSISVFWQYFLTFSLIFRFHRTIGEFDFLMTFFNFGGSFNPIEIKLNHRRKTLIQLSILAAKKIEKKMKFNWIIEEKPWSNFQFFNFSNFWDPWARKKSECRSWISDHSSCKFIAVGF